jgi:hypothetical protein
MHVTQTRFVEHVDARDITIGQIVGIDCAATDSDGRNVLLNRLDKAIRLYYDTDETSDEINPPSGRLAGWPDGQTLTERAQ